MMRLLALTGLLLICGCPDAAQSGDLAGSAELGASGGCLERPSELPRPPTGGLPCELIPPPLKLSSGRLGQAERGK